MLEGKRLYLRASIGVATTEAGPELLRNADLAMYAAKAAGTNRCALFTEDMHINAVERLDRREQLERAIENDELRPALPADRRPRPRPRRRLRGAGALAAPGPRLPRSRASSSRWPRRPA